MSDAVLVELGIEKLCTLCCDYYHLLEEDWPKYFGSHAHHKIKPYLQKMLSSCTEDEFPNAYISAIPFVQDNAKHATHLQKIFKKPSYFGGYYLRQIEGHMELKGSVPAEQNHSSICANLGREANWSVVEHCSQLIIRQAYLSRKFREIDNCLNVPIAGYKSSLEGQEKLDDELAKKSLSDWAYTKKFEHTLKNSRKLEWHRTEDGDAVVWPIGTTHASEKRTAIEKSS